MKMARRSCSSVLQYGTKKELTGLLSGREGRSGGEERSPRGRVAWGVGHYIGGKKNGQGKVQRGGKGKGGVLVEFGDDRRPDHGKAKSWASGPRPGPLWTEGVEGGQENSSYSVNLRLLVSRTTRAET